MTSDIMTKTVAEIVADNFRTAEVFKKYNVDFCCGGKKAVTLVCTERGIDFAKLQADLVECNVGIKPLNIDFNEWTLTFLTNYIVQVHHAYVNRNMPLITEFATKVANVHGFHNPETVKILGLWTAVCKELTAHMRKEEVVLFPYIQKLEANKGCECGDDCACGDNCQCGTSEAPAFGTVKNPISMMEDEHDLAGKLMKEINGLSNNYTAPEYACNTYKVLYAKLQEFENDLHVHIHLENNILFPKAIALEEKQLKGA